LGEAQPGLGREPVEVWDTDINQCHQTVLVNKKVGYLKACYTHLDVFALLNNWGEFGKTYLSCQNFWKNF